MAGMVPLISSGAAGPLGAIHLPRLWQKVVLSSAGRLAAGYDECGMGFDQMVLDGLRLERSATLEFLRTRPTYPQFEKWILEQRGGRIPREEVDALNAAIRGYNHSDETRREILSSVGLEDDGAVRDAVTLNNLEDWSEFHSGL